MKLLAPSLAPFPLLLIASSYTPNEKGDRAQFNKF